MRLTALRGALRQAPLRHGVALAFVALAAWGVLAATRRGIRFVDGYPAIGTIADAVLQRSLEGLFVILMAGVAFSVLTGAITTLYASQDLPLLLALPLRPERVFGLKTLELFVQSAAEPRRSSGRSRRPRWRRSTPCPSRWARRWRWCSCASRRRGGCRRWRRAPTSCWRPAWWWGCARCGRNG
jgi:hypothetical protein